MFKPQTLAVALSVILLAFPVQAAQDAACTFPARMAEVTAYGIRTIRRYPRIRQTTFSDNIKIRIIDALRSHQIECRAINHAQVTFFEKYDCNQPLNPSPPLSGAYSMCDVQEARWEEYLSPRSLYWRLLMPRNPQVRRKPLRIY